MARKRDSERVQGKIKRKAIARHISVQCVPIWGCLSRSNAVCGACIFNKSGNENIFSKLHILTCNVCDSARNATPSIACVRYIFVLL